MKLTQEQVASFAAIGILSIQGGAVRDGKARRIIQDAATYLISDKTRFPDKAADSVWTSVKGDSIMRGTTDDTAYVEDFWKLIVALGRLDKVLPLQGCWYVAIDEQWEIAVNGHDEALPCSQFRQHAGTSVSVEPFHCYVVYNGWPAGILSPAGGEIAAGESANLQTLCEALRKLVALKSAPVQI